MTAITTEPKDRALLTFVQKLKETDDRGTLALLRGALSDSGERQMRAWRVLARFGGIPADDPHIAEVVRTVAGLLALPGLRHVSNGNSFGQACRSLLSDDEFKSLHKSEQPGPVARRMQHLLAATRGEVCDRVRQLGRRLDHADGAPSLDFNRLYSDLIFWSDRAKAQWAADFWGAAEDEENTAREGKA
jgi:CRISPR type I-E-associated protein CasB/Cse2